MRRSSTHDPSTQGTLRMIGWLLWGCQAGRQVFLEKHTLTGQVGVLVIPPCGKGPILQVDGGGEWP